ncbi:MAG: GNAT family N-acetyltransferase [bacterium]
MIDIRLIPSKDILTIIPLLQVLNPQLSDELLTSRLQEMVKQDYRCVGIFDGNKLIGCSGLWILTKYYVGRHIEPDNVVILPEYREQGIGKKLMQWIYEYAIDNGCEASELNCYITNAAGQKFWMNEGYKILGFHYQKKF